MPPVDAPEAPPAELTDELATLGFGPDEDDLQAEEPSIGFRMDDEDAELEPIEASGVVIALFATQGKAAEYVNGRSATVHDRVLIDQANGFDTTFDVGEPIFTGRGRGRIRMYLPIHVTTDRRDVTGGDTLRSIAYAGLASHEVSPLAIRVELSR